MAVDYYYIVLEKWAGYNEFQLNYVWVCMHV